MLVFSGLLCHLHDGNLKFAKLYHYKSFSLESDPLSRKKHGFIGYDIYSNKFNHFDM